MSGVDIVVTNRLTGAKRTAQSDDTGNFAFTGLPAGATFTVKASKTGFTPFTLNSIDPGAGTSAEVYLQLEVAGKASQITVTGVVGEVRTA